MTPTRPAAKAAPPRKFMAPLSSLLAGVDGAAAVGDMLEDVMDERVLEVDELEGAVLDVALERATLEEEALKIETRKQRCQ